MEYYYQLSTTLSELNFFRNAIETIQKAEEYTDKLNDERKYFWKGNHHYQLAFNHLELGELSKAQTHAKFSSDNFQQLKSADGLATALDISSLIELSLHNYNQAIELAERSLQIRIEFAERQTGVSYNNLGEIHRTIGNFQEAIDFYEKARDESIKNKDTVSEAVAYNNLGLSYSDIGDLEKSIDYFEKSQKIFSTVKIFDVECNLDYCKALIRGRRIYEALKILSQVHNHLEHNKSNKNLCRYYLVMGKTQIQLRNLSTAYEHLALANEIAEFSEFPFLNIETKLKLVETSFLYARIGDKEKWFNEANDWLLLAETIVIEIKQAQLLLELQFLKGLLYKERGDEKNAIRTMKKILDSNLISNYPEMKQRIKNVIQAMSESVKPLTDVDILLYLDKIAQLVELAKF